MGRAIRAIQTRDLPTLFSFFGLEMQEQVLESSREEISSRFAAEVREIDRRCKKLRERERFQLFREALRLAYQRALLRQASPAGVASP
jgi:Nitrogen fixation protein NifW